MPTNEPSQTAREIAERITKEMREHDCIVTFSDCEAAIAAAIEPLVRGLEKIRDEQFATEETSRRGPVAVCLYCAGSARQVDDIRHLAGCPVSVAARALAEAKGEEK